MAVIIVAAVAIVMGVIALLAPPADAAPSRCPRGLSTDRTHPYCPCSLHRGSVMYREP